MNFKNPTYIDIGQTGTFSGMDWQVVGRVVLGIVQAGEFYYWQEFNLETSTGEVATLVYEKTQNGAEWRWFTQFTPEYPMTAEDAASRQVGDLLNLDGTDVKITLLENSRIYFVEGRAPEGEAVGTEANYFNAENGDEMLVVSWTGSEMEYYRGQTITARTVREAFKLSHAPDLSGVPVGGLSRFDYSATSEPSAWQNFFSGFNAQVVWILAIMLILFVCIVRPHRIVRYTKITRISAPSAPLNVGAAGHLGGLDYHITGHILVQIAEVNLQFGRHEYFLQDRQGGEALLVCGFTPKNHEWLLFTPLKPVYGLTPVQAAAVKLGQVVNVAGQVAAVDTLFATTVQTAEFDGTPALNSGDTYYGFAGQHDAEYLLARWNAGGIHFYQGRIVSASGVQTALGK